MDSGWDAVERVLTGPAPKRLERTGTEPRPARAASGFVPEVGKLVPLAAALADAEEFGLDTQRTEVAGEGDRFQLEVGS